MHNNNAGHAQLKGVVSSIITERRILYMGILLKAFDLPENTMLIGLVLHLASKQTTVAFSHPIRIRGNDKTFTETRETMHDM